MAQMERYGELWSAICQRAVESNMEELLLACAEYLEADAARETHSTVVALLKSAAECCRDASFNYYASLK